MQSTRPKIIKSNPLTSVTWLTIEGRRRWFDVRTQSEISFGEVLRRKKLQRSALLSSVKRKNKKNRKKKNIKLKSVKGVTYTIPLNLDVLDYSESDVLIIIEQEVKPIIKRQRKLNNKGVYIKFDTTLILGFSDLPMLVSTRTFNLSDVKKDYQFFEQVDDGVEEKVEFIFSKIQSTSDNTIVQNVLLNFLTLNIREQK